MKMIVKKKINIKSPHKNVFEQVTDFNNWKNWSPWFILDQKVKVEVKKTPLELGHELHWKGEILEEGSIIIVKINDVEIEYKLTFSSSEQEPIKMKFFLESNNNSVDVTWEMQSEIPFFASKDKIKKLTEMDYVRGLVMLKDYCESGQIKAKTIDKGIKSMSCIKYIGLETKTSIDNIPIETKKNFDRLSEFLKKEGKKAEEWFTAYEKYDYINNEAIFMSCISSEDFDSKINLKEFDKDFIRGSIDGSRVYKIEHTGDYKHIANAWTMGKTIIKSRKLKHKDYSIERYVNFSTDNVEDLKVEIILPID